MGTTDKNCNGIVIEVSPIPLEHQIIPLMFKDQPIDRQESLNIIEECSKLPRKISLVWPIDEGELRLPAQMINETIMDANDGSTVCRFARKRWTGRLLFEWLHARQIGKLSQAREQFFLAAAASWSQAAGGLFGCRLEEQALLWLCVC